MRARACDFVYFKRALGFQPRACVCGVWLLEGFLNFSFCVVALLRACRFCSVWLVLFILSVCPSFCFLFCFCFCLPVHISVDCSFAYLFEFVCSFASSSSVCIILKLNSNLNYNLHLNLSLSLNNNLYSNLTHVCARA